MASPNINRPSASTHREDFKVIGVIAGIILVPWFLLTWAAKLAGGQPTYSPFDSMGNMFSNYSQDKGIVWWHMVGAFGPIHPFLFWFFMLVLLGMAGGAGYYLIKVWQGEIHIPMVGHYRSPKTPDSTSRWATRRDLAALISAVARPGCFTIGRRGNKLLTSEKETSLLVIGPTRSGKTSGLVVPNLFEWDGPAIVTSTKSELVDITAAYRQSLGPVYVYDPTGEIGDQYQSVTWSPIAGCEVLDYAWQVASWLCAGLQQGKTSGSSDNDWAHWAESGKLLIAPLLYTAAVTGNHNIVDVRNWILNIDLQTPMGLLHEMLADIEHPENSDVERALGMIMSIDQRPDKERGTVFSTVTRIFSVFIEKAVAQSAMTSRFSPREFLQRKGTLYLCTPRQTPERVASLFVGILMTAVTEAYLLSNSMPRGRLEPELGLFLDELANVVPIEELPSMASQGAGRGVILMSIIQDLSQLRTRYGADKANSILNNHGAKVVLPGISDPETCEQVAKMVGKANYIDVSLSRQDGKLNQTYAKKDDQMATPDALRQLKEGTCIMVYRGKPPTIVKLRPWYEDPNFTELAKRRFFKNADYVSYQRSA